MYLVVIEDKEDGTWWDDPNGFDTEEQAREFARNAQERIGAFPDAYEPVIYRCYQLSA